MTHIQLYRLGIVYNALAILLPSEGRDYTVAVTFDAADQPRVAITGLTPIGKQWAEHCGKHLGAALSGGYSNNKKEEYEDQEKSRSSTAHGERAKTEAVPELPIRPI